MLKSALRIFCALKTTVSGPVYGSYSLIFINLAPNPLERRWVIVPHRLGVAILAFLALTGCSDYDHDRTVIKHPAFQASWESVADANADDQRGEISLISLAFRRLDDCTGVIATDWLTKKPIELHLVETDEWTVVTLKLFRDEFSSPHLQFLGTDGSTFKADIQPKHAVETYHDLVVDRPTVVLKDFGVESQLVVDGVAEIPPGEFATLWIENRFEIAARARFANPSEAGNFLVWWPEGCQTWIQQEGRLLPTNSANISLGDFEGFGLVVTPTYTSNPVKIGLERR